MTLKQFLDDVSPAERTALEAVWTRVCEAMRQKGLSHVPETVEDECRLPEEVWAHLFEVLLDWQRLLDALDDAANATDGEGADMVVAAMTQVFQNRTLHGPDIEDTPTPKGRALEISRFRSLMRKAGMSPRGQDQIIEDVKRGFTPDIPYSKQLSDCDLGDHLIWSTFSEEEEDGTDPFRNWTGADTVRDRLGLQDPQNPDDPEERRLVLLVYRVPSSVSVKYPTIAEAYAGSGWNPNFQCSDPEDDWGYTSGGRPEVVHEVIKGAQFVQDPSNSAYAFAPLRIVDE